MQPSSSTCDNARIWLLTWAFASLRLPSFWVVSLSFAGQSRDRCETACCVLCAWWRGRRPGSVAVSVDALKV